MKKSAENEEISIDIETGDEIELEEGEASNTALKNKLKDLRAELKEVQKERDENLAGWQRSKADLINFRKTVEEDKQRDLLRAKGSIVHAIIPALDSFNSALQDKSWSEVPKNWQEGIERIASQFHQTLKNEGLTLFGAEGDTFDPNIHECMSVTVTDDKNKDETIVQVLQQGYKLHTELIRPAKVIVAQFKETS